MNREKPMAGKISAAFFKNEIFRNVNAWLKAAWQRCRVSRLVRSQGPEKLLSDLNPISQWNITVVFVTPETLPGVTMCLSKIDWSPREGPLLNTRRRWREAWPDSESVTASCLGGYSGVLKKKKKSEKCNDGARDPFPEFNRFIFHGAACHG